jgi:glycosyltransferase involved in cell wall biosynthesis
MVSFQGRLAESLRRRGVEVGFDLDQPGLAAVLVVGGTRQLGKLWRLRRQGVRIVQRLDGRNWLHRQVHTGLRHYLRAESGNLLLEFIRARLAGAIIYQSEFARGWWERARGRAAAPAAVIHNGVDLAQFSPQGPGEPPADCWRVLLVEGSLMGGYEQGLEAAVGLAEGLESRSKTAHSLFETKPVELMIAGRAAAALQAEWNRRAGVPLRWAGLVAPANIPALDRSAHLLYSADLNAACPNSVIEALACGLPVAAFATGALPELVTGDAGRLVPYGGDPWKLDPPDLPALVEAAAEILPDQPRFRAAARRRAEAAFDLKRVTDRYLEVLLG